MIGVLRDWILNIVTLVTFIVLLEILIPSGKIKNFVNLVSGFILIIAIINPVAGFLKKGVDIKEFQITSSNFIDKKEIEQNSRILEDKQMKQIIETYRNKLIRQLEQGAGEVKGIYNVKADVIINDDYKSNSFGEIKRVLLTVELKDTSSDIKPVNKIQKIEVKRGDELKKATKDLDTVLKDQIETKINKMLDVRRENIVITVSSNAN